MTLEELFSEELGAYINELNKVPNMTFDKFSELVEEFIDKNKERIALNESNNLDSYFDELSLNESLSGIGGRRRRAPIDIDDDDEKPTHSEEKPTHSEEKPTPSEEKPVSSEESGVEEKPTPSDEKPISSEESGVEEKPTPSEEKPAPSEEEEETFREDGEAKVIADKPAEKSEPGEIRKPDVRIDKKPYVGTETKTIRVKGADGKFRESELTSDKDFHFRKHSDGHRWVIARENSDDKREDIYNIVDVWYKKCLNSKSDLYKQNENEWTSIALVECEEVKDMMALFSFLNIPRINLSGWNTKNVENMEGMFYRSTFENDSIKNWDVSSCINFRNMFVGCRFSGDLSNWEPGIIREYVFNKDGEPEKYTYTDEEGVTHTEDKVSERRATLPIVGARLVDIENDEDDALEDTLKKAETGKGYLTPITVVSDDEDIVDDNDDDWEIIVRKERERKEKGLKESNRVLTLDEFVNEGFYDRIKNGIKKVSQNALSFLKGKFSKLEMLINDFFVADLDVNSGETINATNILTTINFINKRKPKGVTIYSDVQSDLLTAGVSSNAKLQNDNETYGWIKKDSNEYSNYITFLDMFCDKKSGIVKEDRVPLSTDNTKMRLPSITSDELKRKLRTLVSITPGETGKDENNAVCIFGAPGIGKSSIPNSIIREWNNRDENKKLGLKKSIIFVECGDLELGGFNIPMPKEQNLGEVIIANKKLSQILHEKISDSEFEKLSNVNFLRTYEAPKTWLPVYYNSSDENIAKASQDVANSRTISYLDKDEKGKIFRKIDETSEGGLIVFDEFLRADKDLFKTICQLVNNRSIGHGEYRLGDKWSILLCSNRPCDDDEVDEKYEGWSSAMANRFGGGMYNYIPDFYDWLDWAKKDGHFDNDTLDFIQSRNCFDSGDNEDNYTIEKETGDKLIRTYKNWHYIDKEKFDSGEEPIVATPRGWSNLMNWVDDEKRVNGYSSIFEIDFGDLETTAKGVMGDKLATAYIRFMLKRKRYYRKGIKPEDMGIFFEKDFFKKEDRTGIIDVEKYTIQECTTDLLTYIKSNYLSKEGYRNLIEDGERLLEMDDEEYYREIEKSVGNKLLNMTHNLAQLYGDESYKNNEISRFHGLIVRNIFRLHKQYDEPEIENPEDRERKEYNEYKKYIENNKLSYDIDENECITAELQNYIEFVCRPDKYNIDLLSYKE